MVFLWMVTLPAIAQSVPWTVHPTGNNHTIFIKQTLLPSTDGVAMEPGDLIGVFYDSLGVLACGGYVEWQEKATFLAAYGEDGQNKGFKSGEIFQFKVWIKATNCLIENVEVSYASGGILTHTNQFAADGISELNTLSGSSSSIHYPSASLCGNTDKQAPIHTGKISKVMFQAPEGLVIDKQTGIIDVVNSQPGDYTIYFQSPVCLNQSDFRVHISPKIDLSNLAVTFTDASCEKQSGSLFIDENTIAEGQKPYRFALREVSTSALISSPGNGFTNLDSGIYELVVTDAKGCQSVWNNEIRVTKKNDCVPVISPDNDGVADAYFISQSGTARIYNRYGELKKTLPIPGEWYATDEAGNTVPMGNYVIVCNNQEQKIVITVIR